MSAPLQHRAAGRPVPLAELSGVDVRPVPFAIGHFVTAEGWVLSAERGSADLRERRPTPDRGGYPMLFVASIGRNVAVHVLVAAAFLPPRPSSAHQIRHLDGDCTNNRAENLAWGTAQENIDDRESHGTTARGDRNGMRTHPEARPRGEDNGNAVLTRMQVDEIRALLAIGRKRSAIARTFDVSWNVIDRIARGITWSGAPTGGDDEPPRPRAALDALIEHLAAKPHVADVHDKKGRDAEYSAVATSFLKRRTELVAEGLGDEALDVVRDALRGRGCADPDAFLTAVENNLAEKGSALAAPRRKRPTRAPMTWTEYQRRDGVRVVAA